MRLIREMRLLRLFGRRVSRSGLSLNSRLLTQGGAWGEMLPRRGVG